MVKFVLKIFFAGTEIIGMDASLLGEGFGAIFVENA